MIYQRINKVLSQQAICSRRRAEILIKEKKVMVNGQLAEIGMKVNPELDRINVNGKDINCQNFSSKLILINKPKFVITSCSDNYNRKTILDLLPQEYKKGFYPIGRLDYLSRGLILITNNGRLCYELSHPKFGHKKTYIVKINGKVDQNLIEEWQKGINLQGKKTHPCIIKILKDDSKFFIIKVILKEGRNRQIRRVANLLGYKVVDLKRTDFGKFSLEDLKEGDWKLIKSLNFEGIE